MESGAGRAADSSYTGPGGKSVHRTRSRAVSQLARVSSSRKNQSHPHKHAAVLIQLGIWSEVAETALTSAVAVRQPPAIHICRESVWANFNKYPEGKLELEDEASYNTQI